jgi:Na+/H+-dicarboxylate symporter
MKRPKKPDPKPAANPVRIWEQFLGLLGRGFEIWHGWPLYLRILIGVIAGLAVGLALGAVAEDRTQEPPPAAVAEPPATDPSAEPEPKPPQPQTIHTHAANILQVMEIPANLVLRLLGALAPPLILLAVIQALIHAKFPPGTLPKLAFLLVLNTVAAILIGLFVANTLQPGRWQFGEKPKDVQLDEKKVEKPSSFEQFLENIPKSLLGPLTDNGKAISVIILAVAVGLAVRPIKEQPVVKVSDLVEIFFQVLLQMLHWVIEVIPIAVFCKVANIVGIKGFEPFKSLGAFILAVLLALSLQMVYYLIRIKFFSWCSPWAVLYGMRDALVMAFSTGSSTATMPVTYACLREKVGLREQSASLGSLVGANFNNDGTALYEAMSALFIAQLIGQHLTLWHQFLVVVTSVIASVGAAGIPEAGLVTMTLVFTAVGLDTKHIPMLLAVDWFLDRCRTALNVMGDVNVSCILDGYEKEGGGNK